MQLCILPVSHRFLQGDRGFTTLAPTARKTGCPVLLINGRLSEQSDQRPSSLPEGVTRRQRPGYLKSSMDDRQGLALLLRREMRLMECRNHGNSGCRFTSVSRDKLRLTGLSLCAGLPVAEQGIDAQTRWRFEGRGAVALRILETTLFSPRGG